MSDKTSEPDMQPSAESAPVCGVCGGSGERLACYDDPDGEDTGVMPSRMEPCPACTPSADADRGEGVENCDTCGAEHVCSALNEHGGDTCEDGDCWDSATSWIPRPAPPCQPSESADADRGEATCGECALWATDMCAFRNVTSKGSNRASYCAMFTRTFASKPSESEPAHRSEDTCGECNGGEPFNRCDDCEVANKIPCGDCSEYGADGQHDEMDEQRWCEVAGQWLYNNHVAPNCKPRAPATGSAEIPHQQPCGDIPECGPADWTKIEQGGGKNVTIKTSTEQTQPSEGESSGEPCCRERGPTGKPIPCDLHAMRSDLDAIEAARLSDQCYVMVSDYRHALERLAALERAQEMAAGQVRELARDVADIGQTMMNASGTACIPDRLAIATSDARALAEESE